MTKSIYAGLRPGRTRRQALGMLGTGVVMVGLAPRAALAQADTDNVARTAAADLARRLVPYWQAALGIELLGAYLIGSLAHGGFSRRYSDVDMALVTEAGLSPQALDRVGSDAAVLSPDWGPKLSVFWTDRQFCLGRFPALDRIDYLDHAVVLMERECVRPARPTLEEIRRYLCGAPFASSVAPTTASFSRTNFGSSRRSATA